MKTEVITPSVPGFLKVTVGKGRSVMVPINEFSEEDLKQVGEQWTKELILMSKRIQQRQ